MKSTSQTALVLTLIMLLLVLGAAFFFLYQGRQVLEGNVTTLYADVSALEETREALNANLVEEQTLLNSTEATRTIAELALATTQAENGALRESLAATTDSQATLTAQMAAMNADNQMLEATRTAAAQQPPQLLFLAPAPNTNLELRTTVDISVVASDPSGIAALSIRASDLELVDTPIAAGALITYTTSWTPPDAGSYTIEAFAINNNGVRSDIVTLPVSVGLPVAFLELEAGADTTAETRAQIATAVQTIRRIVPDTEPSVSLTSAAEIEARISELLLPEAAVADFGLLLRALGLLEETEALPDLLAAALVSGRETYYDAGEDTLWLTAVPEMSLPLQSAYAAEYARFLQQVQFAPSLAGGPFSDLQLAAWALETGELLLVQQQFESEYLVLNPAESAALDQSRAAPDTLPAVLRTFLSFPTAVGEEFVTSLMTDGDLSALDEYWPAPPVSSEQVLHVEKYLDQEAPRPVELPDLTAALADNYTLAVSGVLGEWGVRQMLAAPGDTSRQRLAADEVAQLAAGWGGDQYAVYTATEGDALLLILEIVWDSEEEADEFNAGFANYAISVAAADHTFSQLPDPVAECWQDEQMTLCLLPVSAGMGSLIVRAADLETATTALSAYAAQ